MSAVLVDTNVVVDVLALDPQWFSWSAGALRAVADRSAVAINPIIYAELAAYFDDPGELDSSVPESDFERHPLPYAAAFLTSRAFLAYRRRGGHRTSPLPDFYIGAHAAVMRLPLLTRDARLYRTYFPSVELITPDDTTR